MRMRTAVIFDWGGVLMRTEDYTPRHNWDRRLGLPAGTVESVVHGIGAWQQAQQGKLSPDAYWAAVGAELKLEADQLNELRQDFYCGDRLNENLVTLIRRLRRGDDIAIGLLSNNIADLREELIQTGLNALFDAVVISAEIGVMKPAPAAYDAILGRLNLSPHEALLVDDSPANVAGAQAIGMKAVLFTPTLELETILSKWLDQHADNKT
jgi:HAD superfamily hydrolase (TIGR01509 family)